MPKRDPALKKLDKLVGTGVMKGRTDNSEDYNINGRMKCEWLGGGLFLLQRGEIDFAGQKIYALEVIGYDPKTKDFPSTVYSNMASSPISYRWNVRGNVVTHWTEGFKYTGTFSADGKTLTERWQAEKGREGAENLSYDATMTRVE